MVVKKGPSQALLTKNNKVEVCTNEEGFLGAWFPATILDPHPSKPSSEKRKRKSVRGGNKALVRYDTLLSEGDPNQPLTELVDVRSIRPQPPYDNGDSRFDPGDAVDAHHLDAWWPGVVMKAVGDGKYTVGFNNPPDLLELRRSELRPHWDLQDGMWVRAHPKRKMQSVFSPDAAVEVNPNEKEVGYAWFPAIFVGELGFNSFLLQYKSSDNRDVKVVVHGYQIRPQPPQLEERNFTLLESVDVFHDMGWWVGNITKVLTGKKYVVTFKFTKEEKECSHSELRHHLEWQDGKWISKINGRWIHNFRDIQYHLDYELRSKHACESFRNSDVATELESSGDILYNTEGKTPCSRISWNSQTEQLGACINRSSYGKTKRNLKMSQQPDDDETSLSPSKKLKGGDSEDPLSFAELCAMRTPVNTSNNKAPVRDGVKTDQPKVGELNNQATIAFETKVAVKECSKIRKADEEHVEDEYLMDDIQSSGIRSESEVTGGSHAGTSTLLPVEVSLKPEVEQQNEDGVSSKIKKKGTLPELLVEYSKDPETDCPKNIFKLPVITSLDLAGGNWKHNATGVVAEVELTSANVVKDKGSEDAVGEVETVDSTVDDPTKVVQMDVAGISANTSTHDQPSPICVNEMHSIKTIEGSSSEEAMREVETVDSGTGYLTKEVQVAVTGISAHNQPSSVCIDEMHSVKIIEGSSNLARIANQHIEVDGRQVEIGVTGYQDAVREVETLDSAIENSTKAVQMAVARISVKTSAHDHPISLCTDERHSVKTIEGSSNSAGTANQQNEVRGAQVETDIIGNIEQQDSPDLPFVKSYTQIWENIESMDALKSFPQKPHFRPLLKCNELQREASAVAKMIVFASVVEKTPKLQVDDPRDVFDSSLKELVELEMMGFDVKAVWHRLNSLLEMKVKVEQLQEQSKEIEIQIVERTRDRAKHNEAISDIDQAIKALQEKRAVLMSIDVYKGSEISKLQSEANAITGGVQSILCDFLKLAAAAW